MPGGLGVLLLELLVLVGVAHDNTVELAQTGAGGDEVTADHVLLHALEIVGLAADGSLVEHLGRLLEGGGGHEALGLQGGAGNTLKYLRGSGGLGIAHLHQLEVAALELRVLFAELAHGDDHALAHGFAVAGVDDHLLAPDAVVLLGKVELVDNLLLEEAGVAGLVYLHLAHHLADDDLEVLVVDLHTLETVYILNLVDDVLLHSRGTLDGEDVVGRDGTVGEGCAGTHVVVLLHENLLGQGHQILLDFAEFGSDNDLAVAALDIAHGDFTVDFADNGGVARIAGLEELGHTGQTAGDVAGLADGTRNLDEDVTGLEFLTVLDHDVAVDGEVVGADEFAVLVDDMTGGHAALLLALDDDALAQTGGFVFLDTVGNAFLDILELDGTGMLGDDDGVEGVPLGDDGTLLDLVALVDEELRAVGHVLGGEDDTGILVDEADFGQTADNDLAGAAVLVDDIDGTEFVELYAAVALGHDGGVGGGVGGDTTGVERTEGKLRTGFTDGLGGDDADGLALLHHTAGGEVAAVALHADAMLALAGEHRTYLDALDGRSLYLGGDGLGDFLAGSHDELSGGGMYDIVHGHAAKNALAERGDDFVAVLQSGTYQSAEGAAVFLVDDHIVRHIDESTGEVTGVGRLQGGVGQTLTGTVGGDEVLQHGHTFLEVRKNRVLDNLRAFGTGLLRLGHQTTHTGKLGNLVGRTTGTGIEHHEHGVETLVGLGHLLHEGLLQVGIHVRPGVDDLIVTLVVGDEAHVVVHGNLVNFVVTALHDVDFLGRNDNVVEVEGQTALVGLAVTEVLDTVEELAGAGHTDGLDDLGNDVTERLLGDDGVDVTALDRNYLVDNDTAYRGLHEVAQGYAVLVDIVDHDLDGSMHIDTFLVEGHNGFFGTVEGEAATEGTGTEFGDVVESEHHILRRHGNRRTVGGIKDVVTLEHQHLCLENGFVAEGKVHGHLVTVEVGVEGGTCQRVELDGLTFDHLGLEGLDAETVKRRGTVEEHGVTLHHIFENVPDDGLAAVDNFLGALDGLDDAALDELADDERLVELGSHEFGQTALTHLQFRADNDDGTCGIVDTLTKKVLAETALLTLQIVGKRLEGTVAVALHGTALAGIVEKTVDSLLKHTFLVAENDIGSLDFEQTLETVVADEHATVEIIEVGSGETAAVESYQRTKVGRRDGDNLHDHPLRTVAVLAGTEGLDNLQTLKGLVLTLDAGIGIGTVAQLVGKFVEVDAREEVVNGLGTHLGNKLVRIAVLKILIVLRQLAEQVEVFVLGQQVVDGHFIGQCAGLNDHIALVVDDGVEFLGRDTEQIAHFVRQRPEVPDMGDRHNKLNMAGTLATHFLLGNFHTAAVADDALVADALIFTAMALVILGRAEYAFAEKAVALGLISTIVDGLGFEYLAIRISLDILRRGQSDGYLREVTLYLVFSFKCHVFINY